MYQIRNQDQLQDTSRIQYNNDNYFNRSTSTQWWQSYKAFLMKWIIFPYARLKSKSEMYRVFSGQAAYPAQHRAGSCVGPGCKWVTCHAGVTGTPAPDTARIRDQQDEQICEEKPFVKIHSWSLQRGIHLIANSVISTRHHSSEWSYCPPWHPKYCPSLVTVHAGGGCYANIYATFMWKICKLGCQYLQFFPATFNTTNKQ